VFYYSRDRAGEHPQAHLANYTGIFQADAYSGYVALRFMLRRRPSGASDAVVRAVDAT
jgi:hypothetical protein